MDLSLICPTYRSLLNLQVSPELTVPFATPRPKISVGGNKRTEGNPASFTIITCSHAAGGLSGRSAASSRDFHVIEKDLLESGSDAQGTYIF